MYKLIKTGNEGITLNQRGQEDKEMGHTYLMYKPEGGWEEILRELSLVGSKASGGRIYKECYWDIWLLERGAGWHGKNSFLNNNNNEWEI